MDGSLGAELDANLTGLIPHAAGQSQQQKVLSDQIVLLSPDGNATFKGTLEQLKDRQIKQDELEVYLLQQNYIKIIRSAKLVALELSLRGFPLTEPEEKDLHGLNERKI